MRLTATSEILPKGPPKDEHAVRGKGVRKMDAHKASPREIKEFVKLLKQLDEKQQAGFLLMVEGASLLQKKVPRQLRRSGFPGQTFVEIP